ncbi:MAG: DUF5687 family protein [Balneolaceae bacterium]
MILYLLLVRHWALETIRTVALERRIVEWTFVAFVILVVGANLIVLGVLLPRGVEWFTGEEPLQGVQWLLLYYFCGEAMLRLLVQKQPVIEPSRYLHLPIPRLVLARFLAFRSIVSLLTLVPLILFGLYTVQVAPGTLQAWQAVLWVVTIWLFSSVLHWVVFRVKPVFNQRPMLFLIALLLLLLPLVHLYYFGPVLGGLVAPFFQAGLDSPLPAAGLLLLSGALFLHATSSFSRRLTVDNPPSEKSSLLERIYVNPFARFGLAGTMANVELKLILRHKKSRSYLFLSLFFLLYGYYFIGPGSTFPMQTASFFIFLFVTGGFVMNYGQFLISWNGSFFDFYLTQHGGIQALLYSKFLVLSGISILLFLLSIPIALLFGAELLLSLTAALLYVIGIGVHVITYFALWSPKPMDINKKAMFNYEGLGASQFLMGFPFLLLPVVVYVPILLIWNTTAALVAVAIAGSVGLLFWKALLEKSVRRLRDDRYAIGSTFRQES